MVDVHGALDRRVDPGMKMGAYVAAAFGKDLTKYGDGRRCCRYRVIDNVCWNNSILIKYTLRE